MNIGIGYVFYNQIIPDDEIWSDTLKRENLIIVQVGREAESRKGKFNVTIFKKQFDNIVTTPGVMSAKEIQLLLK